MNFIQQIERLQKLNKLIEQERTGTPEELSFTLGVSKRQLFNLIDALKNVGAEIKFSKKHKTYRFEQKKTKVNFSLTLIEGQAARKIYGGNVKKNQECNFISLLENRFTKQSYLRL